MTGFIELRRLLKEDVIGHYIAESRWHWSHGSECGNWWLTVHGFGLRFEIVGPFERL